jgi:hypothetical protein
MYIRRALTQSELSNLLALSSANFSTALLSQCNLYVPFAAALGDDADNFALLAIQVPVNYGHCDVCNHEQNNCSKSVPSSQSTLTFETDRSLIAARAASTKRPPVPALAFPCFV